MRGCDVSDSTLPKNQAPLGKSWVQVSHLNTSFLSKSSNKNTKNPSAFIFSYNSRNFSSLKLFDRQNPCSLVVSLKFSWRKLSKPRSARHHHVLFLSFREAMWTNWKPVGQVVAFQFETMTNGGRVLKKHLFMQKVFFLDPEGWKGACSSWYINTIHCVKCP